VPKTGKYAVKLQLTKAFDYGIVQLSLDGQKLGDPLDLYHDGAVPSGELSLGEHELAQGDRTLRVEIVGANEKAKKLHAFGLDYVVLSAH
jgi:hypothetical protein